MGGFPSDIEVAKGATHEQCKAISTRSGKLLMTHNKEKQGEDTAANSKAATVQDNPALADAPALAGVDHDIPTEPEEADPEKTTVTQNSLPIQDTIKDVRPPPPFPQRLNKQKQ
ncbi:hypothetical protein V6N13_106854 [Hibiscus sabdariffa]